MISLLILLALVMVPLALMARLSITVLARMLGGVSQSEVATRAEFARIREQLLATAGDGVVPADGTIENPGVTAAVVGDAIERPPGIVAKRPPVESAPGESSAERATASWLRCPTCAASVSSSASMCLQCGAELSARR